MNKRAKYGDLWGNLKWWHTAQALHFVTYTIISLILTSVSVWSWWEMMLGVGVGGRTCFQTHCKYLEYTFWILCKSLVSPFQGYRSWMKGQRVLLCLPLLGTCSEGKEIAPPTPVLLPGESHGWRSLMGYSPWGRKESDMTERLPRSNPSWSRVFEGETE